MEWQLLPDILTIDGGYRVAVSETHAIDVMRMAFNWRITTSEAATNYQTYEDGWCYVGGTGEVVKQKALVCAIMMALEQRDEPLGWNKNVRTQEWREDGSVVSRREDHGDTGKNVEAQGSGR
jgi:hypothetical protein